MAPLDSNADGMVRGEAAAAVVLESKFEHSSERYASILGTSCNSTSAVFPVAYTDSEKIREATRDALLQGSIEPDDVAFTHVHAMVSLYPKIK